MSLDHAILGFLRYGPLAGYDLKERFDLSVQHFWPADQSQIYRILAKLDEQGYARVKLVEQENRPDRKVYTITKAGREELHRWLTTPLEMDDGRSASLVQVFFSGQLANQEILAIFQRAAEQCRSALEELRKVPARAQRFTGKSEDPREAWCWFLTLECGIRMKEAKLAWIEGRHRADRGRRDTPHVQRKGEAMKVLILDGNSQDDTTENGIREMLCEALCAKGWLAETKPLAQMRVGPCVGCFNCWFKTPGECAIHDDGREVARAMANCDALIFLSPVTFGGYCSRLKYAVDRMIPTISPLFEKVGGEMHHKRRYPAHGFLAIGWQCEPDAESAAVFARLAARNAINMHAPASGSTVLHGRQSPDERRAEVVRLVERLEACQ